MLRKGHWWCGQDLPHLMHLVNASSMYACSTHMRARIRCSKQHSLSAPAAASPVPTLTHLSSQSKSCHVMSWVAMNAFQGQRASMIMIAATWKGKERAWRVPQQVLDGESLRPCAGVIALPCLAMPCHRLPQEATARAGAGRPCSCIEVRVLPARRATQQRRFVHPCTARVHARTTAPSAADSSSGLLW